MGQIQAVVMVIYRNGRFLMGKRALWKRVAPGYWCPVSGKIESDETPEEAVERETLEEVGLQVKALRKLTEIDSHDGSTRLHWWWVDIVSGSAYMANNEHSELGWFTASELEALSPVFPEDIDILIRSVTA